jgi:bis(5'-adenosyl)-triphosphatase
VNIKPLLPGHVLVCPHRPHRRLTDLTAPELTDLFQAVQRVQRMLARHYFTTSDDDDDDTFSTTTTTTTASSSPPPGTPEAGAFNIAIQDGSGAGQTVPHLHVHVLPRIRGATAKAADSGSGDAIYEDMAAEAGNVGGALYDRWLRESGRPVPGGGFARIEDAERRPRSLEAMQDEAAVFRGVLGEMEREEQGQN